MTPEKAARACDSPGCERKHEARGYCSMHYQRFKQTPEFAAAACSMPDCNSPSHSRGWCRAHYQRWRTTGDPQGRKRPRANCSVENCDSKAASRQLCATHLARLDRTGTTDAYVPVIERFELFVLDGHPDECWPWLGPLNNQGYGRIGQFYAHRVACERAHGPSPAGQPFALHACDNPPCVNPAHLSWGTPSQNAYERWSRTGKRRNL